jgi:urease accessory protein
LFGILAALGRALPLHGLALLAGLFGATHGYANGSAMTANTTPLVFAAGVFVSAFAVTAYAAAITQFLLRRETAWIGIAMRVLGSWIAAIGLLAFAIGMRR